MVMMNIISLLLILCSSTFANAIWGKIIKLPEPPIHKLPGLPFLAPQPITTQKPTQPPAFIPETDPKYCDETEVVKIFSKEQSKKRGVSDESNLHLDKYQAMIKFVELSSVGENH